MEVGKDDVLKEILRLRAASPGSPLFKLCRVLRICPTALIEQEDWHLLALEGAVREYGASYLQTYGYGEFTPARVLEALTVIRTARNEIDARRWKKAKKQDG